MQEILSPRQIDTFNTQKEFDGSHAFPFMRVRINLLDSLRGPAMVSPDPPDDPQPGATQAAGGPA